MQPLERFCGRSLPIAAPALYIKTHVKPSNQVKTHGTKASENTKTLNILMNYNCVEAELVQKVLDVVIYAWQHSTSIWRSLSVQNQLQF